MCLQIKRKTSSSMSSPAMVQACCQCEVFQLVFLQLISATETGSPERRLRMTGLSVCVCCLFEHILSIYRISAAGKVLPCTLHERRHPSLLWLYMWGVCRLHKQLLEMWPICQAVEYAALAKAYVAKNMPVYGSGAVGGAA